MTPETQSALKTIVERAVRPVRATFERKRRMREELLSHVSEVFDEELKKTGDEAFALAATEQRFGDAKTVAEGLAGSVSLFDRWTSTVERITAARPEEGLVRRALRWAMFVFVVMVLIDGPAIFGAFVVSMPMLAGKTPDLMLLTIAFSSIVAGSALLTFQFVLIGSWLRRALFMEGQRLIIRACAAVLASLVFPAVTVFAACLLLTGDFAWSVDFLGRAAVVAPLFVAMVFIVALKFDAERAYHDEWASLGVDSTC